MFIYLTKFKKSTKIWGVKFILAKKVKNNRYKIIKINKEHNNSIFWGYQIELENNKTISKQMFDIIKENAGKIDILTEYDLIKKHYDKLIN
jgi:hypothetical protein